MYHQVIVDSVSDECEFLELSLALCVPCVRIVPKLPFTKLRSPLHASSAHNPSIHQGWPSSYIKRCLSLCTHIYDKQGVKDELIRRFRVAHTPPPILKVLNAIDIFSNFGVQTQHHSRGRGNDDILWLVLGYHSPGKSQILGRALVSLMRDPFLNHCFRRTVGSPIPRSRISWANRSRGAQIVLTKHVFLQVADGRG